MNIDKLSHISAQICCLIRIVKETLTPEGWLILKRGLIAVIENDLDSDILNTSEELKVKLQRELDSIKKSQ